MIKKWVVIGLIILIWTGWAQARSQSLKKARPSKGVAAQKQAKAEKEEPCKAYLVIDARNGKVLEGENVHLKRAPASVVKLMVAYVVLEKLAKGELKLTDPITVSKASSKMGGSQVYLKEGERFTLEQMMKAVMVASANDAAYALAEHIAGSKDAFISIMNEKAKALNMADTEFHSVHGLPPSKGEQEDASSCHDLAILSRALLKYPKILEWTSIKTEEFRDGQFTMNNHNKLLFRMPEVDGLKTGYFRETGFNIVVTAAKNDLRFIVVVLGSPRAKVRDNLVFEKLKKAFAQYKTVELVKKGEIINKEVILSEGEPGRIKGVAGASFSYSFPNDQKGELTKEPWFPKTISGEIKQGQKLGELLLKKDREVLGKVDIVAPSAVPKANIAKIFLRKLGINL
jgi:D-alanyl-D-alanine carboxypeptidase (penicillin-binding protein 5/6)